MFIVEFRHILGLLFDEKKKSISFIEELKIIREVVDEIKKETPYFEFRLIIIGLKLFDEHEICKTFIDIYKSTLSNDIKLAELIAGFEKLNS